MLSVPSDRGCQTYRSENVQTVTGILFPTAVRPAPFFFFIAGFPVVREGGYAMAEVSVLCAYEAEQAVLGA